MAKQSKPAIRFKGFTDAWEQRKLGEVANLLTGFPFESKKFVREGIKLVRGMNVKRGYLDFSEELCECWSSSQGLENYLLNSGDILIQMDGALIGKSYAKIKENQLPALLVQRVTRVRIQNQISDGSFVYQQIQKGFLTYIKGTKTETAVPHLSLNDIESFEIATPSVDEEKKIGAFFESLDHLITLHQRKYDKLQVLKKAMLEKMFPKNGSSVPEIRFKGFTDAWEQRKLGEIAVFSKGVGYSKNDLCEEGTPIILYGRLYTKYETCIFDVDTFVKEKAGSVYSKGGEVIVPASGETAEDISIASVVVKPGILLGGDLNIVSPTAEYDSAFLALTISSGATHKYLSSLAQGKSVVHLHNSDIQSVSAKFPTKREQEKIHLIFGKIDTLITLHQRELEKLQNIKKSMLEKMFV